ncbi:MAG: signal peptidase II [Rhodospirillales bacterium]|nr:signal peptidase II [Rhodospirillales bacterium]
MPALLESVARCRHPCRSRRGVRALRQRGRPAVRLGLILAGLVIGFDQLSKWWIITRVMNPPHVIEIAPFFNLVMAWNRGVSFGLFNQASEWNVPILAVVTLGIVVALILWLRKAETKWVRMALGLVIGGALGNLTDRLRLGAVADFLDFHAFGWHWPAFNVADSAISVGAVLLIADSLFRKGDSH